MYPLYFGSANNKLYGFYHPAESGSFGAPGVLLCYPVGHEYFRTHKTYKLLATQLAQEGFHVLRFDYQGTGDSMGDDVDVVFSDWLNNIEFAVNELQGLSGSQIIYGVGARLGASLLVSYVEDRGRRSGIDYTVLWDPVISGDAYLNTLNSLHQGAMEDELRFAHARQSSDAYNNEFLGFRFSSDMADSISSVTPALYKAKPNVKRTILITANDVQASMLDDEMEQIPGSACGWQNLSLVESSVLVPGVNRRIVELLKSLS